MVQQGVSARRDLDGASGQALGLHDIVAPSEHLGPHAEQTDRRLQVVAPDRGVRKACCLVQAIELEESTGEQRCRPRRSDVGAELVEAFAAPAQMQLGGRGLTGEQLDDAGMSFDFEQAERLPEIDEGAARRRDHPTRCLGSVAQRLQHGLSAQSVRLYVRRPRSDAQDADDIQASSARTGDRRGAPQRGERSEGEDRVRPPTVVIPPSGGQSPVQRGLARGDLTERGHRTGQHELGVGDTRVVAVLREHLRRPARALGNRPQLVR